MYQILNLTKRLDAVEMTVERFATMLEAVTRGKWVSKCFYNYDMSPLMIMKRSVSLCNIFIRYHIFKTHIYKFMYTYINLYMYIVIVALSKGDTRVTDKKIKINW